MYMVIEGIDGSGKDTQALLLQRYFPDSFLVQEPWEETPIGKLLRKELSEGRYKSAHAALFLADRYALQETQVLPALMAGRGVISIRSFVSTLAYQQENQPLEWLYQIHSNMLCYPTDIVFIDVTPKVGLERVGKRRTPQEIYEKADVLERVRQNYLSVLRDERLNQIYEASNQGFTPDIHIVNGDNDVNQVTASILRSIEKQKQLVLLV